MPGFEFPSEPYFVTYNHEGLRVYYTFREVGDLVRSRAPETMGKHIFVQLDALGLREAFDRADTPYSLPYTFAEAIGENNA
tara:strand:+ start:687 stop:929 length:243 start_codon:yes stop_codon:yes gene_type:complete